MATRTMYTRKGVKVETTLTDQQAYDVLRREVESKGDGAGKFMCDLMRQSTLRGLSAEQWIWVHKLAMERLAPAAATQMETPAAVHGGLQSLVDMLASAAKTLKHPRIVYRGVRLSIAGERSRHPGSISVTDDARSFGDRLWYGRITPGGAFHASRSCPLEVAAVLTDLASDPAGKTAAEGKRTGACCFCGRELSTKESLHVGYGPICAGKYGLPWGETGEAPSAEALAADGADDGDGTPPPAKPAARGRRPRKDGSCERCGSADVEFSNHCGAKVCNSCDAHQGLARCFCGWSASGRDGRREPIEMGETIEEPDGFFEF